MKIYLDVLMITNAVITLIYINCICRVMHEKISSARETAAAAVGGAGSLIAVLDSSSFLGALGITAASVFSYFCCVSLFSAGLALHLSISLTERYCS